MQLHFHALFSKMFRVMNNLNEGCHFDLTPISVSIPSNYWFFESEQPAYLAGIEIFACGAAGRRCCRALPEEARRVLYNVQSD